ncbi:MAG: succinate dehydrogenase hydrophobic membrane anchor subunit [Cryobacterium sp.]|nr:succinate dehydrogenase hydrophobic membrane anchor subunit [Micrococcales bacterium]MBX3078628.1 succinate dehydrogenase hydrophobic membrane anchor subunit [Cryobacterium sp.]MBX3310408.1 succinate dehydrogenase hydrophobic membrane anchor subunit [Cryobacterium sp.]MCB1281218.1 succinate dehydrogenase hydrophobic membrane anchor subunit [Salinibacterium sp.]
MTVSIETPRAPRTVRRGGINWEKWGWIYMRVSGVALVVLIFGHLFVNLMIGDGVKALDFAFVGGKLSNPFWQWWDTLLLWLALIHGANGMRTITNDYARNNLVNLILKGAILAATIVLLILGTLVIFTFDPCPAGAAANLLPTFCSAG